LKAKQTGALYCHIYFVIMNCRRNRRKDNIYFNPTHDM